MKYESYQDLVATMDYVPDGEDRKWLKKLFKVGSVSAREVISCDINPVAKMEIVLRSGMLSAEQHDRFKSRCASVSKGTRWEFDPMNVTYSHFAAGNAILAAKDANKEIEAQVSFILSMVIEEEQP